MGKLCTQKHTLALLERFLLSFNKIKTIGFEIQTEPRSFFLIVNNIVLILMYLLNCELKKHF